MHNAVHMHILNIHVQIDMVQFTYRHKFFEYEFNLIQSIVKKYKMSGTPRYTSQEMTLLNNIVYITTSKIKENKHLYYCICCQSAIATRFLSELNINKCGSKFEIVDIRDSFCDNCSCQKFDLIKDQCVQSC